MISPCVDSNRSSSEQSPYIRVLPELDEGKNLQEPLYESSESANITIFCQLNPEFCWWTIIKHD